MKNTHHQLFANLFILFVFFLYICWSHGKIYLLFKLKQRTQAQVLGVCPTWAQASHPSLDIKPIPSALWARISYLSLGVKWGTNIQWAWTTPLSLCAGQCFLGLDIIFKIWDNMSKQIIYYNDINYLIISILWNYDKF